MNAKKYTLFSIFVAGLSWLVVSHFLGDGALYSGDGSEGGPIPLTNAEPSIRIEGAPARDASRVEIKGSDLDETLTFEVESALHVPLVELVVKDRPGGDWIHVGQAGDLAVFGLGSEDREFYLPGHRIGTARAGRVETLLLEPESVIQFESHLGDIDVGSVEVGRSRARDEGLKSFMYSADKSLLTLIGCVSSPTGKGRPGPLSAAFEVAGKWRATCRWMPGIEELVTIRLPDLPDFDAAPLIVQASGGAAPGLWKCAISGDMDDDFAMMLKSFDQAGDWGSVEFNPIGSSSAIEPAEIPLWSVDGLLIGRTYMVAVWDDAGTAYARAPFVHDGTPVSVELRPVPNLEARLVDSETRRPIGHTAVDLDLYFGARDCSDNLCGWNGRRTTKTDEEGVFSIPVVSHVPMGGHVPYPVPMNGQMELTVVGYEQGGLAFDSPEIDGAANNWLGDVPMVRRVPDLRLESVAIPKSGDAYIHLPEALGCGPYFVDAQGTIAGSGQGHFDMFLDDKDEHADFLKCLSGAGATDAIAQFMDGSLIPMRRVGPKWLAAEKQRVTLSLRFGGNMETGERFRVDLVWKGVRVHLGNALPQQHSDWTFDQPLDGMLAIELLDAQGNRLNEWQYTVEPFGEIRVE